MAKKASGKETSKAKGAKSEKPVKKAAEKSEKPKKEAKASAEKPAKAVKAPKVESVEVEVAAMAAPAEEAPAEKPAKAPKAPKVPKPPKLTKAAAAKIEANNEEVRKWIELKGKHGSDKAVNYSMSGTYPAQTPIQHKVLGWGYVLTNNNDRLEVLFETGKKVLISNYQPK